VRIAFMHRQLEGGGTEADLVRVAAGLVARGHTVDLICVRPAGAPVGVRTHRVPVLRAGRLARLLSFAAVAPRLAARCHADVVVGFGRTLRQDIVRVGGGTHRSYLAQMQRSGGRGPRVGPYHRAILWLEGRMFGPGGCREVVAVSARAAAEVRADYGVAADHVRVLYNGVDLERFHPRPDAGEVHVLRHILGIGSDERVVLGVGSGFVRKGFDLLLRLWQDAPPIGAHLVLVGRDQQLARFRREAAALGARVHVLGPRDDVPLLMAAADVVCVPSRQEAFGNVVLEAMASGTPVVTSRLVGAAELLHPPLDDLVVPSPEALPAVRRALERACGEQHRVYAAAARLAAEARPWSRHLDEMEHLLAECARGG
jgi:UDP-glucose:(heptosyl)LPS alpha-1,3-glucosyltransferase